jgi:hypothetical protein
MLDGDRSTATSQPRVRVARGNPGPLVLAGGSASTALALAGVWAASRAGENVMGWYGSYVIPAGALLVGVVASSGFGLASWATGARVTGRLLAGVVLILLAGYGLAHYLEFRLAFPDGALKADGSEAGFLDYYDAITRSFAWKGHGKPGRPLGAWGYGLRALEIVGFVGGGVLVPFLLRNMPYCEPCALYMRSSLVAVLPAGVRPGRAFWRRSAEAASREALARDAEQRARSGLARILDAARRGDGAALATALAEEGPLAGSRAANRLSSRIHIRLVHCRRCEAGELRASLLTGQGNQLSTAPLETQGLEKATVSEVLRARAAR